MGASSNADRMRDPIVAAIGTDIVYVGAGDDVRHFDPLSLAALYAGSLVFGFARAGATWLWGVIQKKMLEEGEARVGDAIHAAVGAAIDRVVKATSSEKADTASQTDAEQAKQLDVASAALADLGTKIAPADIDTFLAAGEAAITKKLIDDNLPEATARRVAAVVTLQVQVRLSGPVPT